MQIYNNIGEMICLGGQQKGNKETTKQEQAESMPVDRRKLTAEGDEEDIGYTKVRKKTARYNNDHLLV